MTGASVAWRYGGWSEACLSGGNSYPALQTWPKAYGLRNHGPSREATTVASLNGCVIKMFSKHLCLYAWFLSALAREASSLSGQQCRDSQLVKMMKMSGHWVLTLNRTCTSSPRQDAGDATEEGSNELEEEEEGCEILRFGHGMAFALMNYPLAVTIATCTRSSWKIQSTSQ